MKQIGKYKVVKELGSGGFGAVYLCEDTRLGVQVAIKVFKVKDENLAGQATSASTDAAGVLKQRFMAEAKTLHELSETAYIVNIKEYDELDDGTPYYVMPYLPNSLENEIGKDAFTRGKLEETPKHLHPRKLPVNRCIEILGQLLEAISAVHHANLVHRDIKPANILFDKHNKVQLCDFGIAKLPDVEHSQSGVGMGSRNYMSPEQRESAKHVSPTSDVYSIAVVAYRMITGQLPGIPFEEPFAYAPNIGETLNELIVCAMSQKEEARPQDGIDFLKQFKQAVNGNLGGSTEETGFTATDVSVGNNQIKMELKPVQQKVMEMLQQKGEVGASDKAVLQALADLIDIESEELDAFITKTIREFEAESVENKAFVRWVGKLNNKVASGNVAIAEDELNAITEAGLQATGKSKEVLAQIIQSKGIKQASAETSAENHNADDAKRVENSAPVEEKKSNKAAVIVGVVAVIAIAGFFVLQPKEQQVAQQSKQTKQAQQTEVIKPKKATQQASQTLSPQQADLALDEQQRDQTAWSNAQRLNTVAAYQAYLAESGDKAYESQALTAIEKLEDEARAYQLALEQQQAELARQERLLQEEKQKLAALQQQNKQATEQLSQAKQAVKTVAKSTPAQTVTAKATPKKAAKPKNSKIPLVINTTPGDAEIINAETGVVFGNRTELAAGKYQFILAKDGYHSQTVTINLTAGSNEFSFSLARNIMPPLRDMMVSMVTIPSGTFRMGSKKGDENELPKREVAISSFKLMKHELTWSMYQPCIDAGVCPNNYRDGGDNGWGKGNRPVIEVSRNDIVNKYIPWLYEQTGQRFRLPSEAEWEYAAKAGSSKRYTWGNSLKEGMANCSLCGSRWGGKQSAPVMSFPANAFKLYDMHANVGEWVQDCWNKSYRGAPTDGSAWMRGDCSDGVYRGGHWDNKASSARSANRTKSPANKRSSKVGFRLAQDF